MNIIYILMEQLKIFLKVLYNKNGEDILVKEHIFTYKNGSYSAFSNLFRFVLLYKKGGYWADTDLICVKKIDIKEPYVLCQISSPILKYTYILFNKNA